MIETPADYRSFVFYKANKTPVCSLRSSFRSFVFCKANKTPVCSLRSGIRSFVFYKANKTPVCSLRSSFRSFVSLRGTKQSLHLLWRDHSSFLLWSGFPLQVLAPPSSGCGLSISILHANKVHINFTNYVISKDSLQCVSTNFAKTLSLK